MITTEFQEDLQALLNKHNKENASNTPDFILANFLIGCLKVWSISINDRERFYGRAGIVTSIAELSEKETK